MKRLKAARHPITLCTPLRSQIGPMLVMAETFFGLASMPRSETMNLKSMPRGTPKTLLGVELDALLSKAFEGYCQVIDETLGLSGLDYDVVFVGLDGPPNVVTKDLGHAPLVRGTCVYEAEGHRHVAVHAEWCDERSCELVGLFHLDLMVTRIRIKERQGLVPCGGINDLIDSG